MYASGFSTKYTMMSSPSFVTGNAAYFGGLIYATEGASVTITKCTIAKNQAVEGTVIYLSNSASLTLGPKVQVSLNTVFKRGLIVANQGSTFNITGVHVT